MTITTTTDSLAAAPAANSYRRQAAHRLAAVIAAAKSTPDIDTLDHVTLACLIGVGHAAISADRHTSGRGLGYLTAAARVLDQQRDDDVDALEIALFDALLAVSLAMAGGPADRVATHLGRAASELDALPDQDGLIHRALLAMAYALASRTPA